MTLQIYKKKEQMLFLPNALIGRYPVRVFGLLSSDSHNPWESQCLSNGSALGQKSLKHHI